MKRHFIYLIVLASGFFPGILFPGNVAINKVGEWGTGLYYDVSVQGGYLYCAAGKAGLDIIDISNPAKPKKVGNHDTPGIANALYVNGHYAYTANLYGGLQIFDISDPGSPVLTGSYNDSDNVGDVYVKGDCAYLAYFEKGMQIIDVSGPSQPALIGEYITPGEARGVYVAGNYAYVADGFEGLQIIDVTRPSAPVPVGSCSTPGYSRRVAVFGNYAYLAGGAEGLQIVDVTEPSAPVLLEGVNTNHTAKDVFISDKYAYVADDEGGLLIIDITGPAGFPKIGHYDTQGYSLGIAVNGNFAYAADYNYGLQVIDVSAPSSPTRAGSFDNSIEGADGIDIKGNYAYVTDYNGGGLHIVNISNPVSPAVVGKCFCPGIKTRGVDVSGNYAYVAGWNRGLKIIDVSIPSTPILAAEHHTQEWPMDVDVSENYAYISGFYFGGHFSVHDVSNPSNPSTLGDCALTNLHSFGVYVVDQYAYVAASNLEVIDVSNPTTPTWVGNCGTPGTAYDVNVVDGYAYVADDDNGLLVIDVSDPATPFPVASCDTPGKAHGVYVIDGYAYVADGDKGLHVIDVFDPTAPTMVGSCDIQGIAREVYARGNYVYVTDFKNGKLLIFYIDKSSTSPRISVNRSRLNFAVVPPGTATPFQLLTVTNSGGSTLAWTASSNQDWLKCSPSSGTGSGEISVSINNNGLLNKIYNGTIMISDANAANSPQTVEVTLTVYRAGRTSAPFGAFSTPIDGGTVSGGIPVTGWALDDIGVQRVRIFSEEGKNLVFICNAAFVAGARPDVEQAYPGYPMNYKAGWGYMLLTNLLPNDGNGTFNLHAYASDMDGHRTLLGTKTIICDNANAVKPFGIIDTPEQGGVASGNNFINWGWALTPPPNMIPTDGSTIRVWVDGMPLGHPVYNQSREDVADLFPGYNNSGGAGGYFSLDTTRFENGVHTIAWSVADDAGNAEGIGSRYFTIRNLPGSREQEKNNSNKANGQIGREEDLKSFVKSFEPLRLQKGYNPESEPGTLYPDDNGRIAFVIRELERITVTLLNGSELPGYQWTGFQVVGERTRPLPAGSFLDSAGGIFYWQPGPGFIGDYEFIFLGQGENGQIVKRHVTVKISAGY